MLLALDVDGVILNFDDFYAKVAYEKFGEIATIKDKKAWNMNQRYGLSEKQDKEIWQIIWQIINKSNWTKLPIFEDVKQAVKIINQLQSKSDLEVIFVSSFNQKYFDGRFHDLQCAGFNLDKHQLIACGTGNKSKLDFIKAEKINWFVDDRITNLYDVSPISKNLIHVNRG